MKISLASLCLLVVPAVAAGACGGDSGGGGGSPDGGVTNQTTATDGGSSTFNAAWRPTTRFASEADIKTHLMGPKPTAATLNYTFAAGATSIAALKPGDIVVLPGVAYRKVVEVRNNGATLELVTARTTLPQVMKEATIDWEQNVNFASPAINQAMAVTVGKVQMRRQPQIMDGGFHFAGSLAGGWHADVTLTPSDSQLGINVIVRKMIAGQDRIGIQAMGHITGFRSRGHVFIREGREPEFQQGNRNIAGEFHLIASAFNTGASQELLDLPIGVEFPIAVGPVPLIVKVSAKINITVELNVMDSSAQATVDFSFNANQGLTVNGSSLSTSSELGSASATGFTGGSADAVAAGMTACVEAPRVELSMAGEFASVALTQNNCATTFFTFNPACNEVNGSIVGIGLAQLGFFGITLAEGQAELYRRDLPGVMVGTCD